MRTLPAMAAVTVSFAIASTAVAQIRAEASARTGVLVPTGNATATAADDLGDTFGVQIPLFLDIGVQPIPRLFVGAYGGIGVGGAGGHTGQDCSERSASCIGRSAHLGAQVQWHFRNRDQTHAWAGYGLGYEWARMIMSADPGTQVVSYRGPEYAHLMFGIDFESNDLARIGVLIDYSMASYTSMKVKSWSSPTVRYDDFETSMHGWMMLGLRGVLLP